LAATIPAYNELDGVTSLYNNVGVVKRKITNTSPHAWRRAVKGPRLDAPNRAFSEKAYPDFKRKLEQAEKTLRLLTREFERELNKRLYPWKR